MSILDTFAHGLLGVIALFAGIILEGLTVIEQFLRYLLSGVGLSSDAQSLALIFVELTSLLGVVRLLRGRIRFVVTMFLLLLISATLGRIARMP